MVKAGLTGAEAFEVIEGREVLGGIGEGDEFAADRVPVPGGRGVGGTGGHVGGVARLCGGIGERVVGAVGQDGFLGYFEGGVCAEIVESAPDGGRLDVDGVAAEAVMVRKAALQGAIDEQGYDWAGAVIAVCVLLWGFLGFHAGTLRVLFCRFDGTPAAFLGDEVHRVELRMEDVFAVETGERHWRQDEIPPSAQIAEDGIQETVFGGISDYTESAMCAHNQRAVAVDDVGGLRSAQGGKDGAQLASCGAQGVDEPGHIQGSDVGELIGQAQDQFAVDLGVAIEPVAAEQSGCVVDGAVERADPVGGAQGMVVGVVGLVPARPVPRVSENERGAPRGTPVAAFNCAQRVRVARLGQELCGRHGPFEEPVFTVLVDHGHAAGVSSPDLAAHQQA